MANGKADGEIIVETELDKKGFEAGCEALMNAINSLAKKANTVNRAIRNTFKKPLEVNVDADSTTSKLSAIKEKAKQIKEEINRIEADSKAQEPSVNVSDQKFKAGDLKKQIDALLGSIDKLEPAFKKAMSGNQNAADGFNDKVTALESKIKQLKARLQQVGNTKYPTAEYSQLNGEIDKTYKKIQLLVDKQEKMQATGVSEKSQQWKSLQYDLELTGEKYSELLAKKNKLESSGKAFQLGTSTEEYSQMSSVISTVENRLSQMVAKIEQFSQSSSRAKAMVKGIAATAAVVARNIGKAALWAGGKLVSGLKAGASSMAKMLSQSKSMSGSFGSLISGAKKFALSLLGARGVWAILRKAVSAYMDQNQQLANTLQGCWTGIGNILGPVIEKVVNLVAQAVSFVLQFLKLFGIVGKSTSKAIGSASSSASKASKELKRQLASFDELNVLSDSKSESGSGGGGKGTSTLPDVEMPDWAKLIAEQLNKGEWATAAKTLADHLNQMVDDVNWTGLGDKIGGYVNGALTFIATFIKEFDWKNLGANLGLMFNHVIDGVNWSNLGVIMTAKWAVLLKTLDGFFSKLDGEKVSKALTDYMDGTVNAADWVGISKSLSKNFSNFISNIDSKKLAISLSSQITTALKSMVTAIENFDWYMLGKKLSTFLKNVDWSGIFDAITEGIGAALGGLTAFLWGLIEDAWNSVIEWWQDVAYEDGEFTMEGLLDGISKVFKNIGTWIKKHIFQPFIDGFKKAFGIHSPSTVMAEQGGYLIDGLFNGIGNVWSKIRERFDTFKEKLSNWFANRKANFFNFGKSAIEKLYKGIGNIWATISERFNAFKEKLSNWFTNRKENFFNFGSGIITKLYNGIGNIWTKIKERFSTFWTKIYTWFANKKDSFINLGSKVVSGLRSGIGNIWSKAKEKFTSFWTSLKTWFSNKAERFKSLGSNIINNLKSGIGNIWSKVSGKFADFWTSLKNYIGSKMLRLGVTWDTTSTLGKALTKVGLQGMPKLSFYAKGGIVDRPTLSMIGEAGKEAVIPLQRNTGWMKTMAQAIAGEIKSSTFSLQSVIGRNALEVNFPNDISNSLWSLSDALNAVVNSPVFRTPIVANSIMPYRSAATLTESNDKISQAIEQSNNDLGSVVIQSVANATSSIVSAIQDYSGTDVKIDINSLTTGVINEINRRTRMNGKPPLLI